MINKDLKRRIIEISYKHKLAHLGSCLTAVDIINEIYAIKKPDEKFVLSSGHAGLALYCVIEKYSWNQDTIGGLTPNRLNAEKIFGHHGVHPDRCEECGLDCSTGSLGQGLPIAVGMALADRSKDVYCLISDGECSEGSIYEALNIMHQKNLTNLKVYMNYNGWTAYRKTPEATFKLNAPLLERIITSSEQFPFLKGQDAHYYTMKDVDYKTAMEVLR